MINWISVKDKLPEEDEEDILIKRTLQNTNYYGVCYFHENEFYDMEEDYTHNDVTHWYRIDA